MFLYPRVLMSPSELKVSLLHQMDKEVKMGNKRLGWVGKRSSQEMIQKKGHQSSKIFASTLGRMSEG
jgi:hypothetical protein